MLLVRLYHQGDGNPAIAIHLNQTSISQVAAQAALEGPQECITPMVTAFRERHDYVAKRFNQIPGLNVSLLVVHSCLPGCAGSHQ